MADVKEMLGNNSYPGRGIIIGSTPSGRAAIAYFIMGRSENSRNRVFVRDGEGLRTEAFDPAKLDDPSLIIYWPLRVSGGTTIVTNGDQTDTIYEMGNFEDALESRCFEPDEPNYTPRISGIVKAENGSFSYKLSILKRTPGGSCMRSYFSYATPEKGVGHLIHTYQGDGNPLPSFVGEPRAVELCDDIDAFTADLWQSLNADNRVSLIVRYIDTDTLSFDERIVNRLEG